MTTTKIFCAECQEKVDARLTDGREIYPHRADLAILPFWIHDVCGNYVGCHHKTDRPTEPQGIISTAEIRQWRVIIHRELDPLWRNGKIKRRKIYALISRKTGHTYHTGNIRSVEEAREVYKIVRELKASLMTTKDLLKLAEGKHGGAETR